MSPLGCVLHHSLINPASFYCSLHSLERPKALPREQLLSLVARRPSLRLPSSPPLPPSLPFSRLSTRRPLPRPDPSTPSSAPRSPSGRRPMSACARTSTRTGCRSSRAPTRTLPTGPTLDERTRRPSLRCLPLTSRRSSLTALNRRTSSSNRASACLAVEDLACSLTWSRRA